MLRRGYEFAPGYRLQEFLGKGQFGQVWRASAPGGTAAAIKFIDLSGGQGNKEFEAVKRIKAIRHANLMPIIAIWLLDEQGNVIEDVPDDAVATIDFSAQEAGQSGMVVMPQREPDTLVVAMLLGGASLLDRMNECVDEGHPGIPPRELLSYMEDSAKGLDFLNEARHDLGEGPVAIQHCDVKPANIVVLGNSAMICDFGLARILTRNQVTATSASGTPAYMAPEAIAGKPSQSSDQYSLAVTYYHLRTGKLPVADGTLYEVLEAHRRGDLSFAGVGKDEQTVLRRATDLDWKKRFECNADLVDALRDALKAAGFAPASFVAELQQQGDRDTAAATAADAIATQAVDQGNETTNVQTVVDPLSTTPGPIVTQAATAKVEAPQAEPSRGPSPKLIGGIAGAAVVVIAVVAFALSGGGSSPSTSPEEQDGPESGRQGIITQNDPPDDLPTREERSPAELVASAREMYATNREAAVAEFELAVRQDASLIEPAPLLRSGHADAIEAVWVMNDGRMVTTGYDPTPFVWSSTQLEPTRPVADSTAPVYREAVTLVDERRGLAAGASNRLFYWPLQTAGSPSPVTETFEDEVLAITEHPSRPLMLVALADMHLHLLRRELDSMTSVGDVTSEEAMSRVAVTPEGDWLIGVTETGKAVAFRWQELEAAKQTNTAPSPIPINAEGSRARVIEFVSADGGSQLLIGDNTGAVSRWSIGETPQLEFRDNHHEGNNVECVAAAAGIVASGDSSGRLVIREAGSRNPKLNRQLGEGSVSSVDLSEDGLWVAAGTYDGQVWLVHTDNLKMAAVLRPGTQSVDCVRLDVENGRLLAGTAEGTLCEWSLEHCQLIAEVNPMPIALPSAKADGGDQI